MKSIATWIVFIGWVSLFVCPLAGAEQEPLLVIEPQGHSARIWDVLFTPDGQTLISASEDKTIRLWDVATGDLIHTLRGQIGGGIEGIVMAASLSPDGKLLASGGNFVTTGGTVRIDRQLRLIDVATGEQLRLFKGHTHTTFDLAFAPDGKWLASASHDQTVKLWDVATGAAVATLRGHTGAVYGVAFAPDGSQLVSASFDGTLRLWDLSPLRSGSSSGSVNAAILRHHTAEVRCVAYAPDGHYIVSGGYDHKILLWDSKGAFIKELGEYPGIPATVAFAADSRKIVVCGTGDYAARVYAIPSGEVLTTFRAHTGDVMAAAFYGSDWIATAGGEEHDIYIWNATTGAVKTHIVGQGQSVRALALRQQPALQAAIQPYTTEAANDLTGFLKPVRSDLSGFSMLFDAAEMRLDQRPPSAHLFASPQTTFQGKTFNLLTPRRLRITGAGTIENSRALDGEIRAYAFTPDGEVVVGSDFTLKLYRSDGRFVRAFSGHTSAVRAVAISADGRFLVSGSRDQTIKFWNLQTGECLASLFITKAPREWICWTPQGYYAASAGGEKYIGWHLNQGDAAAARFYPVSNFRVRFYQPELVKRTLALGSFKAAFAEAGLRRAAIQEVLPPHVEWLTPTELVSVTNEPVFQTRVKVVSDTAIAEIKPLLNGRPLSAARGLNLDMVSANTSQNTELERTLPLQFPLQPGENRIAVYAANEHGGHTAERIVVYTAAAPDVLKSTLYMASIGISDYQFRGLQLNYADDDAEAMSHVFRQQEGRFYQNVQIRELYNQAATRAAVLTTLDWLTQAGVTDQDVVIVFVAAHGYNDQGEFFFMPADGDPENVRATGVSWLALADVLSRLSAQVLLLLDTCHSGQFGLDVARLAQKADNTEALRQLSSDDYGVVIMAASTGREFSLEDAQWGHGVFTYALLEALEQGQADYSGDGLVNVRELDLYVADRVDVLTGGNQHPTTQKPSTISRFPLVRVNK